VFNQTIANVVPSAFSCTAEVILTDNPEGSLHISYNCINGFAKWQILEKGITKGDRVCIYLPMIPELAVSILACARMEPYIPLFCRVFSFCSSYQIMDSECKMVITSDGGYRGNKTIALKK
jgi:acetyl-CoA synthetase